MNRIIQQTKTFLSVYYDYMMEYRAELFLWALSGTLPLILMGVWTKASQSGQFGLQSADFARYFLTVFFVRQITAAWVIWEFEKEVMEGRLSFRLLQPIDPVWHHVAGHLSERLARLPFTLVLIGLFFFLYPDAIWQPNLGRVLLFLLVLVLAFTLRFLIQYTVALFAFWTERASAIEQFWFLFYLFLSGMIAPLEVFPSIVRDVVKWTPFPYLIHFPASILIGLPIDIGRGLLMMLIWIGLFFIANRWLWRKGLKHYSGMGA